MLGGGAHCVDIKRSLDVLIAVRHKIGGPQGAGAIVRAADEWSFAPLMTVATGEAAPSRYGERRAIAGFARRTGRRRSILAKPAVGRVARPGTPSSAAAAWRPCSSRRAPAAANPKFRVPGLPAENLLIALDLAGVAVSRGSACSFRKSLGKSVPCGHGVAPHWQNARYALAWVGLPEADLDSFATAWRHGGKVTSRPERFRRLEPPIVRQMLTRGP
jgi:cysteine desulfurase